MADPRHLYVIKEEGKTPASDYYWSQRDEIWTGELSEATQYGTADYARAVLDGIRSKRSDKSYRVTLFLTELNRQDELSDCSAV